MKKGFPLVVALTWLFYSTASCAAAPQRVDVHELVQHPERFVGVSVTVHGCLVFFTEGASLGPCSTVTSSKGRVILVSGTAFGTYAPIVAGNKVNPKGSINCVVGDYVGEVKRINSPWHPDTKMLAIYLGSFSNASLCN